jgi:hypothetical protein
LFIYVRHSEREDEVTEYLPIRNPVEYFHDPPLTERGKDLAYDVGKNIVAPYIRSKGYEGCEMLFICSPFIRTL